MAAAKTKSKNLSRERGGEKKEEAPVRGSAAAVSQKKFIVFSEKMPEIIVKVIKVFKIILEMLKTEPEAGG